MEDVFFDVIFGVYFVCGVDVYCVFEELEGCVSMLFCIVEVLGSEIYSFVEERYVGFKILGRSGFVGVKVVREVEVFYMVDSFFVEGFGVWCIVEVKVIIEDFVIVFIIENYFDIYSFDFVGK